VPRQDVGTTITITPHLNESNEIRLEISEEISSAGAPENTGNLSVRTINRTKAKTEVVVRDQHTVVIGGLMRDQITTSSSKVPVLGDIPLIGALFRTTDKTKEKKNLLLFLTPYIIRSPTDLRSIYERKMRERQEFVDRYFVFTDAEYEAPVDYSRTRGLLGEIFKEIATLDSERKAEAESALKTEPGHVPKPPIGVAPGLEDEQQLGAANGGQNVGVGASAVQLGNAPTFAPPPNAGNAAFNTTAAAPPGAAPPSEAPPPQLAPPAPPRNEATNAPPPQQE
jgi:general secretion pathway protein D